MASKDVTRIFGSIRFALPLILIFFIAAGSVEACPKHRSSAAYRTNSYSTRTVSYMAPVVITYGGRCADNRRVKYVSMRDNGNYEGGTRYVAVRRSIPRTRYVTTRNYDSDYDYAPRYVSTRYVAARNYAPRTRYVATRDYDYDDVAPRYVAVRRAPVYVERDYVPRQRVVAVRHPEINDVSYVAVQRVPFVDDFFEPRATRVVSVRNTGCGCSRAVSYRTADDDYVYVPSARPIVYRDDVPYISSVRHIVVKTDDIDGTEEVLYSSGPSYDDTAYIDRPYESVRSARYVSYDDVDDVDFDNDDAMYNNVAFAADDDMGAACVPASAVYSSPHFRTRSVSYIPAHEINDYDVIGGTDVAYVADDDAAPPLRYEVAGNAYDDSDAAYVADEDIDADCPDDVSAIRYDDYNGARAISYVPTERVNYVPSENVVYATAEDVDRDCSCEMSVNTYGGKPVDDVDAVAVNDICYSGDRIIEADAYDDSVAALDVDNDVNYDPYVDDHAAEIRSDVDIAYVE